MFLHELQYFLLIPRITDFLFTFKKTECPLVNGIKLDYVMGGEFDNFIAVLRMI